MQEILVRAGCFVAIIFLGYALRRMGVFKAEDFSVLSKVVIRVTLPAAIIVSFADKEIDPSMLTLALLGFATSAVYIVVGFVCSAGKSPAQRAFDIVNLPGFNIGNFTLPFVQSFLGSTGVIVTSLFDTGNAIVALGVSFGIASMIQDGSGFSMKRIVKALSKSVPFITYITVVALNLLRIPLPGVLVSCAEVVAGGNAFLAMFMIGVGFKLGGDRSQLGCILRIVSIRYAVAVVLGLVCYFLLPFALEVRQTLVILVFSPVSSIVPAYTGELGGDVGLSSAINSVTIIVSIVTIVGLLTVML